MKLLIFYLTSDSRHYTFPHFVRLLEQSQRKDLWSLVVLTHSNDAGFYSEEMKSTTFNNSVVTVHPHDNYMVKVKMACQIAENNDIPYVMKCDNDIFITAKTLDYMIDNLDLLNNGKHLTLGPSLSSGIPGVEYFTKDFLTESQKNTLEALYLKTEFYNRDGAVYTQLNKHTTGSDKWDAQSFFKSVWEMNHHYKGIHPIRINQEAINFINQCLLENKSKFFDSIPNDMISDDSSPYLCDSIFCIRTDTYKTILYTTSLFVDAFDEVPLNKYAVANNMNHLFVKNGFGIHMLYNWFNGLYSYEMTFCKVLFSD